MYRLSRWPIFLSGPRRQSAPPRNLFQVQIASSKQLHNVTSSVPYVGRCLPSVRSPSPPTFHGLSRNFRSSGGGGTSSGGPTAKTREDPSETALRMLSAPPGFFLSKEITGTVVAQTISNMLSKSSHPGRSSVALRLLRRWEDECENDQGPPLQTFNSVIMMHGQSEAKDASAIAESILERLWSRHRDVPLRYPAPTLRSYSMVIDGYSKCASRMMDLRMQGDRSSNSAVEIRRLMDSAMSVLETMEERNIRNRGVRPNFACYNTVLNLIAKCEDDRVMEPIKAAEGAQDLLDRMISLWERWERGELGPGGILGKGQGIDFDEDDASEYDSNTNYSLSSSDEDWEVTIPVTRCYNKVLNAWARAADGSRAEALFSKMESLASAYGRSVVRPDVQSHTVVINAYARVGNVAKAEDALRRMEKAGDGVFPNIQSYNTVVAALARNVTLSAQEGGFAASMIAAERAEALVNRMEESYDAGLEESVRPDQYTYTSLMGAYNRTMKTAPYHQKGGVASDHIDRILRHMTKRETPPVTESFNVAISAWARSGRGQEAVERVFDMLRKMEEAESPDMAPNVFSYSSVIDAVARSKMECAPELAEEILAGMESRYKKGRKKNHKDDVVLVRPSIYCLNSVLNALAKSKREGSEARAQKLLRKYQQEQSIIRPDTVTYGTVIEAHVKAGGKHGMKRAKSLLKEMEAKWEAGDEWVAPTVAAYNMVLSGMAESQNHRAVGDIERMMQHMEDMTTKPTAENSKYQRKNIDVRPDAISYYCLIRAINRNGSKDSPAQIENILARMDAAGIPPTASTLYLYIRGIYQNASSRDLPGPLAEDALARTLSRYPSLVPNRRILQFLLLAWSRTPLPGRAARCYEVVTGGGHVAMAAVEPDVSCFNAVLQACSYSDREVMKYCFDADDREGILNIALAAYDGMRRVLDKTDYDGWSRDKFTYYYLLKVILDFAERDQLEDLFKTFFDKCCIEGFMCNMTLEMLCMKLPQDLWYKYLGEYDSLDQDGASVDLLPASWHRNSDEKEKINMKKIKSDVGLNVPTSINLPPSLKAFTSD
uniref:Pentacotripeptide-repeat region of PRORP domain-containing protein n=1 Tax=Corethron hystrix TaxID=216773 RepID=A0A6U5H3F0_9STRA|mmetsp:Transcript_29054/g.66522  ORF Transcript_29054/g.66522 Transcript_29054/m.66522 type:complete len:1058 (+) Transcript_29054:93-3266(+)